MCDIYLSIFKHLVIENLGKIILNFILNISFMYIVYHFYCRKNGRMYHNNYLETLSEKNDDDSKIIRFYLDSKNILGFVTFLQWLAYMFTIFTVKGISDSFSLIIPLLFTYIFENLFTVKTNEKNIPEEISKKDLDKIKISNIFLIVGSIIVVSLFNPQVKSDLPTYLSHYFSLLIAFIFSYFGTLYVMHSSIDKRMKK